MKAELVKRQDRWDLYGEDGSKLASSAPNPFKRLSIKNCEAIERGYDLDELAEKATNKQLIRILGGEDKEEVLDDIQKRKFYFIEGAKAILEILGDKKFSELDMRIAYDVGCNNIDADGGPIDDYNIDFQDTINLLQQNEWEVEIMMEEAQEIYRSGVTKYIKVPKLDTDGCLILKRI